MLKNLKEISRAVRTFRALVILAGFWSCDPPEERLDPDFSGTLHLSADTLFFDTLFTSRQSITKRFYVKNTHNRAIKADKISLGTGENSPFRIAIQGRFAHEHQDVTLLGNDSLLVLVEALIDPKNQDLPFLVKDSVVFEVNQKIQDVKVVAWGQDAHFLGDEVLDCNSVWTNDKPYVLHHSILIDSLCTLRLEKGVRVYCAPNTFIYVKGSLKIEGTSQDRVIIRNDRFEPKYQDALGQWGGILFLEGTKDNRIEFARIRNGQTALRLGSPDNDTIPDLILKNVVIENMSGSGILSFTSDVYADNTLVNNCREFAVANLGGGHYTYLNCTFANYSFDFIRETPATVFTNYLLLDDETEINENLSLTMINTIIYGDAANEITLDISEKSEAVIFLRNNLLKTTYEDLDVNFNILNEDPEFRSPFNFEFQIDSLSPAVDQGADLDLNIDLDSTLRDDLPDIGAYEFKPQ